MTVSRDAIRNLRDSKAWSQQHLADAAGLSLRTIQRVEAEGTASAETRLAIAAALGVPVETLVAATDLQVPTSSRAAGSALVFAACGLGTLFVLWLGSQLPDTVASHFGVSGTADARMSREAFVVVMGVTVAALPALVWWLLERAVRLKAVSIPNAEYWFAAPQWPETKTFLLRHVALLCVSLTAFVCFAFWLVASANSSARLPAQLDVELFLAALAALLVFITVGLVAMNRRFRRTGL